LNTDHVVSRFEIPESVVEDGKGLAALTVDDDDCSNSFVYIPDWSNNALIVFSLKEQQSWRFDHNFFHFNPFEGDFSIDGERRGADSAFNSSILHKSLDR
jgi:dopachrome tautomerase